MVGNSLTGIGTIAEALTALDPDHDPDRPSLFRDQLVALLDRATGALTRLATVTEATVADVRAAAAAQEEASEAVEPARRLFDLLVAARLGQAAPTQNFEEDKLTREWERSGAGTVAEGLRALHFPVAFPEVFLRDRPGFDCILGNPPWEEATVEKLNFWALRFPGLKSMNQADQRREIAHLERQRPDLVAEYERELAEAETLRKALIAGPFPGMGTGDPDVYKAFCWRFWHLARHGGAVGVVLPRSALSAAGSAAWRQDVLARGCFDDVTMILNNVQWMFEDVHPQYTIGLVTVRKGLDYVGAMRLRGPFRSLPTFRAGATAKPAEFAVEDFLSWSEGASFPLIPNEQAVSVFQKLRAHPRLDAGGPGWAARPTTEFHATNDKRLFNFDPADADGLWPVYKGASFNLWEPDTGTYYAWADPREVTEVLQDKRLRSGRRANSVWSGFDGERLADPDTLPCWRPRIAFRDVARATDSRTVIAALVPGSIVITNKAPYLLWSQGAERDEAFLLGVLCSIPLDWYARRVVEISLNFHILNGFPIPNAEREAPLRRRVEHLAGRLASVDERYEHWAEAVGVPVGSIETPEEKDDAIAELDALVAHLYGLDETDLVTIFETFHEGWNHEPRLSTVLAHHRRLA